MELTQARVRELFDYREDGNLVRRIDINNKTKAGQIVGCQSKGYKIVMVDRKFYKLHRLIFFWHHGWMPENVDHKDTDKQNNRIGNLRQATTSQNGQNRAKPSNNTSGHKGVCWHKRNKKWFVQVSANGVKVYTGYFHDLEDAIAAYSAASQKYHGAFSKPV